MHVFLFQERLVMLARSTIIGTRELFNDDYDNEDFEERVQTELTRTLTKETNMVVLKGKDPHQCDFRVTNENGDFEIGIVLTAITTAWNDHLEKEGFCSHPDTDIYLFVARVTSENNKDRLEERIKEWTDEGYDISYRLISGWVALCANRESNTPKIH